MSHSNPNPTASSARASKRPRWRLIPAAITFVLGILFGAVGIYAVLYITYVESMNLVDYINPVDICAGCFLYLGPGIAWTTASVLFWRGRMRIAWSLTIIGILIPIVLFALLGF
jgi:hypothetical protein